MKSQTQSLIRIILVAAAIPTLATAQDKIVSANFHKGANNTVPTTGSWGAERLGAVTSNWNNHWNVASATDLLDDDGIASTVDFTSSGFYQFTNLYPDNLDYGGGRYNGTPLRAGPPTTSAGAPIVVNLADLNASFPNGYKVAVYLTGRLENAGASISDGTSTYFFRQPAALVQNVVVNGDFETGTDTTFALTTPWYNTATGLDQNVAVRGNSQFNSGAYSGTLVDSGARISNQKTSHVIASGDTLVTRFAWRELSDWAATDKINVRLFYTSDNTLAGTQTIITTITDTKSAGATWKLFYSNPVVVPAGAVGKNLFVELKGENVAGTLPGFCSIDDLVVSVYPGPSANQRVTTDTNSGDGYDPANLAIFGSDAAPLTSNSLALTMTALSDGVASIGGIQIISANTATGPTSLISASLYANPTAVQVIEPNSTWGLGAEGSPADSANWNNLRYTIDNGPTGIPLRFSNGVASTVVCTPTDSDNDGLWDSTWGSEALFAATWNNTALCAGRTAYSGTVQYDLNHLSANFPSGYRLIVYLAGFSGNNHASISNGSSTYYFQVGTPTLPPRKSTVTADPGVGNAPEAEYVVFGTESTPLTNGNLTLTLTNLDGGGVAIAGFQIVGHQAAGGFAAWQAANGGTTGGLGDDHDGDGVDNGTEYFLFGNASSTGFTRLPGVDKALDGTLSVTWTKAAIGYSGAYDADFVVETSDTLTGWTPVTPPTVVDPQPVGTVKITGNDVKYIFPSGTKKFARLKVSGP